MTVLTQADRELIREALRIAAAGWHAGKANEADRVSALVHGADSVALFPVPSVAVVAAAVDAGDWRGRIMAVAESLVEHLRRPDWEGMVVRELTMELDRIVREGDPAGDDDCDVCHGSSAYTGEACPGCGRNGG